MELSRIGAAHLKQVSGRHVGVLNKIGFKLAQ
jgi:hypothetical protein